MNLSSHMRDNDYDLYVIDNGSSIEGKSKHTSFELGENVYFGGGFNAAIAVYS